MSYTNQTVLVTGANRGIGLATVRELLKTDVKKVYAATRNLAALPTFDDARVVPLQLDIIDSGSIAAAAKTAADVDILINNAGTATFGDLFGGTIEDATRDFTTNFYGTYNAIRAFVPTFRARKSGTIVNVVSVVGLTAAPMGPGYSASKAALQSLTQSLRNILAADGIRVLGVYPGPIDTDMAKELTFDKTSPEDAAIDIVAGVARGDTYIFPDPFAKQIGALWEADGRALDAVFTAADETREAA